MKNKRRIRWNLFVPFALFAVHEFKESVCCNFHRESLYGLLLLVRTLRGVRGSRNSKGVSVVDSNRERRENREQKRSVPCRSEAVPGGKERKENGVSPVVFGQAKKGVSVVFLTAKVCTVCFSSFVSFALFAVHRIQRECPLYFRREKNNRERRENCEQKRECPL